MWFTLFRKNNYKLCSDYLSSMLTINEKFHLWFRKIFGSWPLETVCQEESKSIDTSFDDKSKNDADRKISKLKEKLASIQTLKAQKRNGKQLEKNQIDKIEREMEIKLELEKLEEMC